jgi:hypothetical protein
MKGYITGFYDLSVYLVGSYGNEEIGNTPTSFYIYPTYPEAT